jgi:hypothetical protein
MPLPITLAIAMLVAASPLLGIIALTQLPSFEQSAWRTAFATFGAGLAGCISTMAAVYICATGLAQSMPGDDPERAIGAGVFLPIGALFTFLALLIGVSLTLKRAKP